jgi:post-segregation antitoxin (ccd killing protein)
MTTITIDRNGVEFIHTNVLVPRNLRDLAKEQGVSLSKTLNEALELKFPENI